MELIFYNISQQQAADSLIKAGKLAGKFVFMKVRCLCLYLCLHLELGAGDGERQDSGSQARRLSQEPAELHFRPSPKQPIGKQELAAPPQ